MCDFETTVYDGQKDTEVWASASVELFTEDVKIFHSIEEQFNYFVGLNENVVGFYHNLKFDGTFWLDYLLVKLKMEQAVEKTGDSETDVEWLQERYMKNNTFKYSISDKGQWYTIIITKNNHFIDTRN